MKIGTLYVNHNSYSCSAQERWLRLSMWYKDTMTSLLILVLVVQINTPFNMLPLKTLWGKVLKDILSWLQ